MSAPKASTFSSLDEASEWDELEARSLVFAEIDGPNDRLTPKNRGIVRTTFQWKQVSVLLLLAICALMAYVKEDIMALLWLDYEEEGSKMQKDILSDLMTKVDQTRNEFDEDLYLDYGKFKEDIFTSQITGTHFESPSTQSSRRLRRKILIKILEAQLHTNEHNDVSFIWAIGGHSAAAGHGNLFKQTYGNIIEQSLKPTFEALGITFYAKNYAMGGMSSGPELAFCQSAVYGTDIQILSWDFGMTDGGRNADLYNLWIQRAAVHPSSPTIVSFGSMVSKSIHQGIEKFGMSTFQATFVDERNPNNVYKSIPNSDDLEINVDELPHGLKNFRCNNHIESGDICGNKTIKFNTASCPSMKYQVSWHNGWKDHLLKGRLSASFIMEHVVQALNHLDPNHSNDTNNTSIDSEDDYDSDEDTVTPSITKGYLNYLYSLEARDKALFLTSELPFVKQFGNKNLIDFKTILLRSNIICRTAMLPAQSRYDGLVTNLESPQETFTYLHAGKTTYVDEGYDYRKLPPPHGDDNSTEILLAYNFENSRKVCDTAEIDFKDCFFVRHDDQWMTTVLPNDAEKKAYTVVSNHETENDTETRVGLVMLCTRNFNWGKYPDDFVTMKEMVNSTEPMILVNQIPVTSYTSFSKGDDSVDCAVLQHSGKSNGGNDDGDDEYEYVFPYSKTHEPGRYEIMIRIPRRGGNFYLQSLMVF